MRHRVVIIGGGFAGVQAALSLARHGEVAVQLISDRSYFNYHAAVYHVVATGSTRGVAVPLADIFRGLSVEIILDGVTAVDRSAKTVRGLTGAAYPYDTLVLAAGSEPAYFGIPGMEQYALPVISSDHAKALREHIQRVITAAAGAPEDRRRVAARVMVVGSGPSGVEVASVIGEVCRARAQEAGIDAALVEIHLVEAMDRVLPLMSEKVSAAVQRRLASLGVTVHLRTAVASVDGERVSFKDGASMEVGTIVWTAGLKANGLYATVAGLTLDKRGRVEVEQDLRAKGTDDVYVVGDAAVTTFSGMAQTAVHDGAAVAAAIAASLRGAAPALRSAKRPAYAIPVGRRWAAVSVGAVTITGFMGFVIRKVADARYFASIVPWRRIPLMLLG